MQLRNVEALLNITIPETEAYKWQARLDAAIDHAKEYCNQDFSDGVPVGAQIGVAMIVKSMTENPGVSSQSLGDMSKSFFEGGTYKAALKYLKPYRRAGFK